MTCPHGNPIPTEDGSVVEESFQPLTKFDLQEKGTIVKIGDESPDLLRYLDTLGVKPYAAVEVVEKAPFDGPLTIRVDGKDHALSRRIAELIKVQRVEA